MRRRGIVVISVVGSVLLLSTGLAGAQCAFNAPTTAKGIKTSMVRAYAGCPGITFASPNTNTMAGVPGCTPPFPLSEYRFDDENGSCSVTIKSRYVESCPTIFGNDSCMTSTLKARCVGILDAGGMPTNAPGFAFNIVSRRTSADPSSGDLTLIDYPNQLAAPQLQSGAFTLTIDPFELGCLLFECHRPPGCSSIEILWLALADPDGNIFAVLGSSSR